MSNLRHLAKLVPAVWRKRILETIKREYGLGWPQALTSHPEAELNLLEVVLAHYCQRKPRIRFLQVGAADGMMGDPLFPLIERYAMEGVLLEPRAETFARLKKNYAPYAGKGFVFVNAAIMRRDGTQNLYSIKPGAGAADWLTGTASFDREIVLQGLRSVAHAESWIAVEPVKTITFETLFRTYNIGDIDLLQVDAEGFDAQIIEMFDVGKRRPAIVRFEHMHLKPQEIEATLEMLIRHGYTIGRSAYDTIAYQVKN